MLESRKKVDIPLKHIANTQQRGNIAALGRAVCENEYATRYLEGIGVQATKDQRDTVLANMPIEKALVVPVWTSGSLAIVPDRRDEKDPTTLKLLVNGSKEVDYSIKSRSNFYGKGVSSPGSRPPVMRCTNRETNQAQDKTSNSEGHDGMSPSIHVTFPCDGYVPAQEASSKLFKKLVKPLAVSDVRLKMAVKSFSMNVATFVPQIFEDPTGMLNLSIQKFISTPICRRLYGLLCHHIFWNIVHPFAHKVMQACRKQFPHMIFVNQASMQNLNRATMTASRRNSMMSLTSNSFHDEDANAINDDDTKHFDSRAVSSDNDDMDIGRRVPFSMTSMDENDVYDASSLDQSQCTNEYSIPGSMASNVSLSNEEKELLYVQLEDCISQMHAVMGYQQSALKCCRQTLVSGCHYIVHDIICTHYSWLDEKSIGKSKKTDNKDKEKKEKKHKKNNHNTIKVKDKGGDIDLPKLSADDKKNIQSMRKGVLKSITITLTELLDPARVFASRISKEMFNGEDITLRELTASDPDDDKISHGQLRRVRESKDAHRKGKFTSTSLAVQAIFSHSSCCPETRKFLLANGGKDDRALALARLGKGKSRHNNDLRSLDESSQVSSNSSGSSHNSLGSSLEFSLAAAEKKGYNEENYAAKEYAGTIDEFKSLLADKGIDPMKRSKLGLSRIAVEPEPKFLAELNVSKRRDADCPSRIQGPGRVIASKLNPMEKKRFEDGDQLLSTAARSRLMTLVVNRSKTKYKDESLLQNSRHPNAKYRKDLLSTGGNSTKLF